MSARTIQVAGRLMGRRLAPDGRPGAEIVHVQRDQRPEGPAENSFVLVEIDSTPARARYVSWINYYDLEYAARRESPAWELVEPWHDYRRDVAWHPFGWPGAAAVPTIGDAVLEELKAGS
jgi:hypothetical protein